MRKNVYEASEQVERNRKERIAEREVKSKLETCLAALKTCFMGEELS